MYRLPSLSNLIEKLGIDSKQLPSRKAAHKPLGTIATKEQANQEKKRKTVDSLEDELKSLEDAKPSAKRRKMEYNTPLCLRIPSWRRAYRLHKQAVDRVDQLRKRHDPSLVTREEWLSGHMMLMKHLFYPPADVKKTWRGVIMTDGISFPIVIISGSLLE
jgi:hypothetical protein